MKRLALFTVFLLAAAAGTGYATYPDEFMRYAGMAEQAGLRVWGSIEAYPVPVLLALGTFLLTVIYHKAKGKTLRESVEVAATRVTFVSVPTKATEEDENPVVKRAQARATRTQLVTDQIGLQNRLRKLPEELLKAEKETCYTEQAVAEAEEKLVTKRQAHEAATERLEALRKELAAGDAELAAIDAELKKLSELV